MDIIKIKMNQEILLNQIRNGDFSHAYLLCGEDEKEKRKAVDSIIKVLKISPFDVHFLEKEEEKSGIPIEKIRELKRLIQLKPHSSEYKLAIIFSGENLTIEAGNALLKTLEEPPSRSLIFITVKNARNILPTINSRCQKVYVSSSLTSRENQVSIFSEKMSLPQKFNLAEKISKKDKEEIKKTVQEEIENLRIKMLLSKERSDQQRWKNLIEQSLEYFNLLQTNANSRLILENFILDFQ